LQLAYFNEELRRGVLTAIKKNPVMSALPLRNQFRQLVADVFAGVRVAGPVVVVIDALDECGNERTRREFLQALREGIPKLPSIVKVVITSRHESDIEVNLSDISQSVRSDETDKIRGDIDTYLKARISEIVKLHRSLDINWPGEEAMRKLS